MGGDYKSRKLPRAPARSMTRHIIHKLAAYGHRGQGASAIEDVLIHGIAIEIVGGNEVQDLARAEQLFAQRIHVVELIAQ